MRNSVRIYKPYLQYGLKGENLEHLPFTSEGGRKFLVSSSALGGFKIAENIQIDINFFVTPSQRQFVESMGT